MSQENFRWNPGRHRAPMYPTITVTSLTDEQVAERERKLREGARLVPFGFARALAPAAAEASTSAPVLWDGDQA